MSYSLIERPDTIGSITISKLVPNGDHFINAYGDLIHAGETLPLHQFAQRIRKAYPSPLVAIEAGELERWNALMCYAEDSVVNFNALPLEFEYPDDGAVYGYDDIVKILGEQAVDWLTSQMDENTSSAA